MVEAERALIAAKDGDLQTLRSLRRSTPFAADGFGATALHYASRTGQMECVKWLVEAIGISPNVRGRSGATPLHDAAAQGQLDCVKYFLASGAVDVETRDGSGHTALHLAARFGRFESVKWLTEKGNSNARAKSRNHMTPVHFAASGGHLTCLELLVFKAGYSVNDVATDGTTPLYLATQDGNLDCLKYLHSVGGKCDGKARDGMLPIHGAAQNGHLDCVGYLIESGQADLSERDKTGATPAHYAAAQGHVSVLKWLNAKGDISSVDKLGGSPLHDAAEQGQFECIRYLVENADLDVNQTDKEGLTPLALAEKNGHRRCLDYLKIATSKHAKAQKRQMETKKQHTEKDCNKSTISCTTPTVTIQANSQNPATKKWSTVQRESSEGPSTEANNNIGNKGAVKTQAKRDLPSQNPAIQWSTVAQRGKPEQTSKQHTAANNVKNNNNNNNSSNKNRNSSNNNNNGNSNNNTNSDKNNDNSNIKSNDASNEKKANQPARENTRTTSSSSFSAPSNPADSSSHTTQSMEINMGASSQPATPLRERQLLPLPHFGDIIPPPVEFSEYSDASDGKGDKLQPPKENVKLCESKVSEHAHLTGLFERSSDNHQVRVEQVDDFSVIVEVQSVEKKKSVSWQMPEKYEDGETTVIGPENQSNQPMENGDRSHVTSSGRQDRRINQSVSEEFGRHLPPWKLQILVNRKLKEKAREKAEREKREIEDRKWIGVPQWKIPLLSKREEERLKDEQRWVGMPEWKKNLLSRRGTGRIYRDYHAINSGNFLRRTRSAELRTTTQSTECDYFTRPRGISSLN